MSLTSLPKLMSILELTREQVQYGYFTVGIKREQTSNLAEHHYLVTMLGWLLCTYINEDEQRVDTERVMRMCLVHDLGELFGGDMAAPLSRKRPDIKQHAQAFERGNMEILLSFIDGAARRAVQAAWEEEEAKATEESILAKIADLLETHFFLEHRDRQGAEKDAFYEKHIRPLADRLSNMEVKRRVLAFFDAFDRDIRNQGFTAGRWILEA